MRKFMKQEKYLKLKNILLDAITDDLINDYSEFIEREYDNKEFNSNPNHWNDKEKFEFAYKRYQAEAVTEGVHDWLQGMALPVPYWNDDITDQGLNSETYWNDLSRVLIRENETMFSPSGHNDLDICC